MFSPWGSYTNRLPIGLFLRTPFTEGYAGANKKASPPGRHQEQASKQCCIFSPTTFSSVQYTPPPAPKTNEINPKPTLMHVRRCLNSEMTRKQGPILSRMVPRCVVLVQIGVKNFLCGSAVGVGCTRSMRKGESRSRCCRRHT